MPFIKKYTKRLVLCEFLSLTCILFYQSFLHLFAVHISTFPHVTNTTITTLIIPASFWEKKNSSLHLSKQSDILPHTKGSTMYRVYSIHMIHLDSSFNDLGMEAVWNKIGSNSDWIIWTLQQELDQTLGPRDGATVQHLGCAPGCVSL